jgi:4-carboxymuconolactone decarboxylase
MPRLGELTRELVYGDIWERPGLSKRDRSLITIAMLTAMYRTNQIRSHMRRALANGVTKDEIGEVLMHMAFYAGWPCAVNAFEVAKEVFYEG